MMAIFSRTMIAIAMLFFWGCAEREPATISPPKEAAAVIDPFLTALAKGDRTMANALVSTAATDELAQQFAADHGLLSKAPMLKPRFFYDSGKKLKTMGREFNPDGREVTLVYAGQKDGKWTSATVRIYRYRDEPFKVEYWRITNEKPQPVMSSGFNPAKLEQAGNQMRWLFGGIALFGAIGLALLIWILRRKPHLVVADGPEQARKPASTVRD